MNIKSDPKSRLLLGWLILLGLSWMLSSCSGNRLRQAEMLFEAKRYAGAIQELDKAIRLEQNGAVITRAELLRSRAYYELGLLARERSNWALTIRFLKIANSLEADVVLAEVYRNLGAIAEAKGDNKTLTDYLNLILRETPQSVLVPEVLAKKVNLMINFYKDNETAWEVYKLLFDSYPDNTQEIQARNNARILVPGRIQYAQTLSATKFYTDALNVLFDLDKYPVVDHAAMQKMISDVFQAQAESLLLVENYLEADKLFRIALQYYPAKKAEIDAKLTSITRLFIDKGDSYLAARDFENAMLHYQKTFEIIPDYAPALRAIERLEQTRLNIARAAQLFKEAEKIELTNKAEALRGYQQAYNLEALPEYRQKIGLMQNLIEADRNPEAFTQKIINEFRGGMLNRKLQSQLAEIGKRYKASEIRNNGWKILLSSGQYKYEARFDILTPQETYFYVWQVNLRDRTIIPLNKISEALMK